MVNVNVDVEHSRNNQEELLDGHDNIINVAKSRRVFLHCVMQASGPVDGNVGLVRDQVARGIQRSARVESTVVPNAIKDRTIAIRTQAELVKVVGYGIELIWRYSEKLSAEHTRRQR